LATFCVDIALLENREELESWEEVADVVDDLMSN